MGRNQHIVVENGQLKENSVVRIIHHHLVQTSEDNKMMSVIQLQLIRSDVVQRLRSGGQFG